MASANMQQCHWGRISVCFVVLFVVKLIDYGYCLEYFSTKNSYDASFIPNEERIRNGNLRFHPYPCSPVHISGVFRHGTRGPGKSDVKGMKELAKKFNGVVGSDDLADLNNWSSPFHESRMMLSPLGANELRQIGSRLAKRYWSLFGKMRSLDDIFVISSNKSRCQDSAKAFMEGVLYKIGHGVPGAQTRLGLDIHIDNFLMRFWEKCDNFLVHVEKNKTALKEHHAFKHGQEIKGLAKSIEKMLKLNDASVRTDEVRFMFAACLYETHTIGKSTWCKLFTESKVHIPEYLIDLKQYWKKSYGYPVNYHCSCPLLADIFKWLDQTINKAHKERIPRVVARFGHAETLLPLYSLLGLFNQSHAPPTSSNFAEQHQRPFRPSKICPFAGNLVIVLHRCDNYEDDQQAERPEEELLDLNVSWPDKLDKYMLQLLVNELPVKFPFCKHDLCPYKLVRKHYYESIKNCDHEKVCKLSTARDEL